MCGVETYLDLVDNPLTEVSQLKELETRTETQNKMISDLIMERKQNQQSYMKGREKLKQKYKKELTRLENEKQHLKHRLKKYKNTSHVPKSVRKAVYERDNHTCQCCGIKEDLTLDHIVPRSRGGSNDMNNLQTLCKSCNFRKGTEFIDYRKVKPLMVREAK